MSHPAGEPVSDKARALAEIARLARRHELTPQEVLAALEAPSGSTAGAALPRLLAALGGIFLFAGVGVLVAMQWDALNSAARILITLGSGIVAFVLALVALPRPQYERAAYPLFLIAAGLQPTGILVAIDELAAGGDPRWETLATAVVMFAQQGATFWRTRRTLLLFTTLLFGTWFFADLMDRLEMDGDLIAAVLGASLLSLTVAIDRSPHRAIAPVWYLASSSAFLLGLFALLEDAPAEPVFLLFASGGVYLSTLVRSRALLVVSTLAIFAYIGYYTGQHFVDVIGWPIALILLGLLLLGLSSLAYRLGRRFAD